MSRTKARIKGLLIYLSIAIVGVIISMSTRIMFDDYLGLGYSVSVGISYFLGMIWGFYMTKNFAFNARESGNLSRELVKYAVVAFSALGLTVITASLCLEIFKWYIAANPEKQELVKEILDKPFLRNIDRKFVANIGGIGAGFFVNFFGHKFLTFRSTGTYNKFKLRQESRKAIRTK